MSENAGECLANHALVSQAVSSAVLGHVLSTRCTDDKGMFLFSRTTNHPERETDRVQAGALLGGEPPVQKESQPYALLASAGR